MATETLRTPDERFEDLPDWPFQPRYLEDLPGFDGMRLHYIDEGPSEGPVFLCLHGQPTWSYLYRKMIPVFLGSGTRMAGPGARVVAFDWFGFGRSDKPVDEDVYTWDFHRDTMLRVVEALDLRDITLVVQDWGGILGLTLPVDHPDRISRLLIMNTAFGVGATPSRGFVEWRDYVARTPDLAVGRLIQRGAAMLTDAEAAAYDAPFPGPEYKAGVRRFPAIVPTDPSMDGVEVSKQAAAWWREFDGSVFMAVGAQDPVLGLPVMESMRKVINGCPEPMIIEEGSHFVQEWGRDIATAALEAWE